MSDNPSRVWMYAAAGLGALVTGALVFHYLSNKQAAGLDQLADEISALGPVKKDTNGLLVFDYYKDLFLLVTKYSK